MEFYNRVLKTLDFYIFRCYYVIIGKKLSHWEEMI